MCWLVRSSAGLACTHTVNIQPVGQVVDGLQEMVGPLFPSSCDLSSSRRPDKAFFYGSGTLPTGQAPNPKCLSCLYLYGVGLCPIGQSKSQGQSQGQCGRGLHKNTDAWKPDTLELLIAAVWHRSQKWKSQRAIRRLYNNTERNDDGLHRGDDNGSFKKCLDSEYSWKNDLICILLSH